MRKTIQVIIYSAGFLLLVYAVFDVLLLIMYPQPSELSFWNLRGTDRQLSTAAQFTAFAATGLWISKKIFMAVRKGSFSDPWKKLFLFFQKYHVLIGWVVLVTTSTHGLYYILHQSDRASMMVTGWIAWSGLIVLAFLGVFFDQRLKEKKKTKKIRLYHIGFSLVFLAGFVLHVF